MRRKHIVIFVIVIISSIIGFVIMHRRNKDKSKNKKKVTINTSKNTVRKISDNDDPREMFPINNTVRTEETRETREKRKPLGLEKLPKRDANFADGDQPPVKYSFYSSDVVNVMDDPFPKS